LAEKVVDDLVAQGKEPGVSCGVPVSMKVNVDELGHATTNGLSLQRNLIAQSDSPVVSNTRAAGGVIVGRSNTLQGSSSSAATAVVSGMCALGHRTDIA
jgi:amidase